MINVYECNPEYSDDEKIIARVKYNNLLDRWDGHNWTNGGLGLHKGITRLKDKRYVIILGSQREGSKDYGYVVSDKEALREILRSDNAKLLDDPKFSDLKTLMETELIEEEE